MKLLCRLIVIVSLSLSVLRLSAGDIRHITMRDGLSSRQVYELEGDNDGFIWMFTNSGLERYDGYHFRHYTLDDSEESNDHIASATTMQLSKDGILWITSKSGVIYSYDKAKDCFIRRFTFPDKSVRLYHFAFSDDGTIIVGTSDGVFLCADGKEPQHIALKGELVSAVLPDADGKIYAGTKHGVFGIDTNDNYRTVQVDGTRNIYVKSLAKASGRLYVGPFADDVFSIDLTTGRKYQLPFKIPPIPVNAMVQRDDDCLLIGVDGAGVYMIDSRDGRLLHHYRDGDGTPCELSGSTITDLLVDKDGGIWISTSHSGVNYLPPYSSSLTIFKPERGNPNSLLSSHVNAVFEDSSGDRWFGTDKGVSRYNPQTGKWQHYLQNHDYSANVILSVGEDKSGNIWVGSYGEGAASINRNTGQIKHLPTLTEGEKRGAGTRYLFTSHCDRDGNIWFGGINGLTTKYNPVSDTYSYYDEDCISVAMTGVKGRVILGGNKGIGVYNPAVDTVRWSTKYGDIEITNPVRSILIDSVSTEVWIGTMGEGLIRYNYETGDTRCFTTADGLSSNTIYTILRDKIGGTWICTEKDLYRYSPKTGQLTRFTNFAYKSLEIEPLSFNPGGVVTANGDVMLPSSDGCIIFNPGEESDNVTSGRLMFTNLMLNDRNVTPGDSDSPLTANIDMVDKLSLDHTQNNITLDFAIINFPTPHRIDYEYMLESYDSGYRKSSPACRIKYSALEPGSYILKVRAIDLYSDTVVGERELSVVIRHPWWQSWWAILIYAVIFLTVIVLGIGYLRNRRREKRIENQIRMFSTIAHDIRTPMSMIKAPLINVEQEQGLSDQGRRNLMIARNGIEKTLNMLTAMLEIPGGAIRREHLAVEPCDISEYLRGKCQEFVPLAMLKELKLTCEISPDMPQTVLIDVEKLNHVVDNLLSNAIKYTFTGTVTVSAMPEGRKYWRLSVKDTGIGIPKNEGRRIFNYRHRGSEAMERNIPGTGMGLLLTRRIVSLFRGKIYFVSQPGAGTEFIVTLPLQYSECDSRTDRTGTTAAPEPEPQETGAGDGRSRIYIIDDDQDMLNFLKETLGAEYDVVTFDDPTAILDRINRENPDMVIADVMMPKLRGDELCRIIKTDISTSHIPVILISGLTSRRDVVSGLESHADDYVVKPFDLIVLKARIKNILNNRRQLSRQVLAGDSKPEEVDYTSELDRQFMTKVMETLNDTLTDTEFSVGDLCSQLGMSRTSVYNKIRSITGLSVNEYIRVVRLNKAKELLSTGRYNVGEVAYMVGFSDPKYFSTCFKKQFGVSPSKLGSAG